MRDKGIELSPKHGVNPSIIVCPICGKDVGIALLGKLKGDVEAPKTVQGDMCDECKKSHIRIVEIAENNKATGRSVIIPRDALTIQIDKDIALMREFEFKEMFENGKQNCN